ncbi:hypothetical protein vseg_005684 [Gypsophila vaccaria]
MEYYIRSILIFLCVTIVGSHAALIGSKDGNDKVTVGRVISHRKLAKDDSNSTVLKKGHSHIKVGPGGIEVTAGPVYVNVKPGLNPFTYHYKGNDSNTPAPSPGRSLFFLEKDMKPGHQVTMNLTETTNEAKFLPKEKARSLPFSTAKMPEILHEFSMQPGTVEARIIEDTIRGCESKGIPGEQKYCATCLEDMIDYAKSILGKSIKAISTKTDDGYNKNLNYKMGHIVKVAQEGGVIVCHKQNYAYAVYYCHRTKDSAPHIVSLINEEGKKAKVVVVCHKDTSGWDPRHSAFQALNVKPGLPICHFLPKDHIAWVRI